MAEQDLDQQSACSEDISSVCEEERIRKLFQACDGDGDGYIDSQDLSIICKELNLEGSVEELMQELGADSEGRISYSEFLRRRLALKNEIDALQNTQPREYFPGSSNNSLGVPSGTKQERWEFDSGARDLSPEPHTLQKLVEVATGGNTLNTNTASLLQLANKLHLAALASLRSEILDLSTRLQAVTEERDLLEKSLAETQTSAEISVAEQYEERLTELHCVIAELNRKLEREKDLVIAEEDANTDTEQQSVDSSKDLQTHSSDQELGENDLACTNSATVLPSQCVTCPDKPLIKEKNDNQNSEIEHLHREIHYLQMQNAELRNQLGAKESEVKLLQSTLNSREKHIFRGREDYMGRVLNETNNIATPARQCPPVPKVAERVRLKRMERHITGSDITSLGVSNTEVAEHLVSGLLEQCNLLEIGSDQRKFKIETEKLVSRLEHTRAFNTLLQISLEETKSHCERLTLLLGKYENNAVALQMALDCCDRTIKTYKDLVRLISTEHTEKTELNENRLRLTIEKLKKERSTIETSVVQLESYTEIQPPQLQVPALARKIDLETAVLIQEVMSMREEKADLNGIIYRLETEKENLELKLASLEMQQQTQLATVQHLRTLNDGSPERDEWNETGNEREVQLQDQLREMAATLERVSRNAEIRQKQHTEMAVELRATNSALVQNIEKNRHKYEAKLQRFEAQMLAMVGRHAAQVQALKRRILELIEECKSQQPAITTS